eukprot:TRINITY_DN8488_c0_g1_i2.p1 TRINITY_DN8488_c0_g1~~TRINITY_DN8488_c0_g1_i2.p1  ORF type:complete len:595 (+),score=50.13 TRINITY_DN8488_c0_g1_i2:47-1831(+)
MQTCTCPDYAFGSVGAFVMVLARGVLVFMYVFFIFNLMRLLHVGLTCARTGSARSAIKSVWDAARSFCWSHQEDDSVTKRVNDKVSKQRLARAQNLFFVCSWVAPGLACMQLALSIHSGLVTLDPFSSEWKDWQAKLMLTQNSLIPALWVGTITSAVSAFGVRLTPRRIDCFHVSLFLCWITRAYFARDNWTLHVQSWWISLARITTGVLLGNAPFTIQLNILYLLVLAVTVSGGDFAYLVWESSTVLAIAILTWLVESSTLDAVRAAVEAGTSARAEHEMRSLLSQMCEAVLQVGPDFRIKTPSPALDVLLLRGDTRRNLKDTSFLDMVQESDRDRMRTLNLSCNTPSIHVHLVDTNNVPLSVQLFFACCPPDDGCEACHLMGVREISEERVFREPPLSHSLNPAVIGHGTHDGEHSCGQSVSSGGFVSVRLSEGKELGEVGAWVDTNTEDLRVVRHAFGFTSICGPSCTFGSFNMSEAVVNKDAFMTWLQDATNHSLNHDHEHKFESKDFEIVLRYQNRSRASILVKAKCHIDHSMQADDELSGEHPGGDLIYMVFRKLKTKHRKQGWSHSDLRGTDPYLTPSSLKRHIIKV